MTDKTYSAGGVVVNTRGEVLVVNQNEDSWSLPKGRLEPGETPQEAASREIREESGVSNLTFVKDLGSYERLTIGLYGIGESGQLKHLTFFLYTTDEMELSPEDPHNPEARWVKPLEVATLLTHPKDQDFFRGILPDVEALKQS
jgi:ADP-ribose pyrophosphatase YjhB (NUDIX family)